MKYSIEIGKIVEGALKYDQVKVVNYTKQLIKKLKEDDQIIAANKFDKLIVNNQNTTLAAMNIEKKINMPVDDESRIGLADIVYPMENNVEVVLSTSNYENLNEFILNYKNADKLNEVGIGVANTLLLYGPPGCGKTKCAYLIAKKLQLPLVVARLDSLISSYLGTTAKNIRILFEYAQRMPCVLFLDEFDAIAKARDDSNELGELKRVVNSLLQNVDSLNSNSILLAATNHDKLLDSAVWRRFSYKLEVKLPDINAIINMVELFTHNVVEFTDKEKHELGNAFYGLSGADVEEIIKKSLRNAIIRNNKVSKIDIYNELFIFKKIVLQNCVDDKNLLSMKANFLRECNEKIFSYAVIADILGVSKTTASKLIKEKSKYEKK